MPEFAIQTVLKSAERLRAFARRARELRAVRAGAVVGRLKAFGAKARTLRAADARVRWAALVAYVGEERLVHGVVPDLLTLGAVGLEYETRHSLVLAAMLDPRRTGPLAEVFWSALLNRLRARCIETDRNHLLPRLDAWNTELLNRLQVEPLTHGAEWNNLDVFARADQGVAYEFGLVVENKVLRTTGEGGKQLEIYHNRIRGKFGDDGLQRTVFVFLTEGERNMQSAGATEPDWIPMHWLHMEETLGDILQRGTLVGGWKWLLHSWRDAIRREILDKPTFAQRDGELRALHAALGPDAPDATWAERHAEIMGVLARSRSIHGELV